MSISNVHGLEQTQSNFMVLGKVSGVGREKFYKTGYSKNGGCWNVISFFVEYNNNEQIRIDLNGYSRDFVYFSKKNEGGKSEIKKVVWKDRDADQGEGYQLIGVRVGLNSNNTEKKNIVLNLTEYDAVNYLAKNLKDGMSVRVLGNMVAESFVNNNGENVRLTKFVLNKIYSSKNEVDFDSLDFEPQVGFETNFVYTGIEKETDENNKATGRYIINGYYVGYSNIESVKYIIKAEHEKLATNIKKRMKPYNSVMLCGEVGEIHYIETVDDDDDWGGASNNAMESISRSSVREYYITKKKKDSSIDTDTYNEKDFNDAIVKLNKNKRAESKFDVVDEVVADDIDDVWDD